MGWIKNRAAKVELRQWAQVSPWLAPSEEPINYVHVQAGKGWGWLYLTDQRLIWTRGDHLEGQRLQDWLPLVDVERFGWRGDRRNLVALYRTKDGDTCGVSCRVPRHVPIAFVDRFTDQVNQAAGIEP